MTNPYNKVNPGDDFRMSASLYNTLCDMAYAYKNSGRIGDQAMAIKTKIKVLNYTDQDLGFGDAVGIEEPLFGVPINGDDINRKFKHFRDRNYIAVTPRDELKIGITETPIRKGEVGTVILNGLVRAEVDVKDVNHNLVTFTENTVKLESSDKGDLSFFINPTSTGKQWCDLVFGSPGEYKSMVKDVLVDTLNWYTIGRTVGGRKVMCPELGTTASVIPAGQTVYLMPVDDDPQVEWYVAWCANLDIGIRCAPPIMEFTPPNTWKANAPALLGGENEWDLEIVMRLGDSIVARGWPVVEYTYTNDGTSYTYGNISAMVEPLYGSEIDASDAVEHTVLPIEPFPLGGDDPYFSTVLQENERIHLFPDNWWGINFYYRWEDDDTFTLYDHNEGITAPPTVIIRPSNPTLPVTYLGKVLFVGSQRDNVNPQWVRDIRQVGYFRQITDEEQENESEG